MARNTEMLINELRDNLAEVEGKFKPLEQERERLRAMIAAAEGKLSLGGGTSSTEKRTRKTSVPLPQAKNKVAHLVKQKPNESGAFYRRALEDVPGNTVDAALAELVTEKKISSKGERKARRYSPANA